jgi:hypothetical protein
MGLTQKALGLAFVLMLSVIVLAALGPCLVQDQATGNPGGAVENIQKSIEQTDDALEDSPVGDFFERIDNVNN